MPALIDPTGERPSCDTPRVVVTGVGLITGLGMDRDETWRHLREGRQAFRILDPGASGNAPPHAGCPVPEGDHRPIGNLVRAVIEANRDARLHEHPFDSERAATVVGMSKGDLSRLAEMHRDLLRGASDESWLGHWTEAWPNAGARYAAATAGFRGPCLAP